MKLIDAIRRVKRPASRSSWDFSAPDEPICESLGIQGFYCFPDPLRDRLKAYPIFNWQCTDEHVGLDALYLDGEPVGCSYRPARKCSYEIEWISTEIANHVRNTIMEYADKPEFNILDPDQEIGDDFKVNYVGQALTDEGFYQGRPVRVLVWYDWLGRSTPEEHRREGRSYYEGVTRDDPRKEHVLVQDGDDQKIIPLDEFRLAFNLDEEPA